jgi:hypothetical protein
MTDAPEADDQVRKGESCLHCWFEKPLPDIKVA